MAQRAIAAWNLQFESEPLVRIVPEPVPGRAELCIAICDYQTQWWGFFGVFALHDGKVVGQAACAEEPDEQSVYQTRGLRLEGFEGPIIEVFGISHMGNGSLYLYELQDSRLELLLKTRAVDWHQDGHLFRDGRLNPDYRDLNGDGVCDLVLCGEVLDYGDDDKNESTVIRVFPCRKVLLWDSREKKFVEDSKQRSGFDAYPD